MHNETKTSLPSREFFIDYLFKGKEHLSEEDLEEIVESLGIGKVSESPTSSSSEGDHDHGHSGHDRRRRRSAGSFAPQKGSAASHIVHRRALDARGTQTNGASGSVSCIRVFSESSFREFKQLLRIRQREWPLKV